MSDFTFYFNIGWHHIININALDHLLFILALASLYLLKYWKQVLILVTAFTVGHSLTLALSVYDVIRFNNNWVEFLIPLTIVSTALFNLLQKKLDAKSLRLNYFLALSFGLVHGMGFANSIRFMLAQSQDILVPLLSFNLGLEAGQIVVVIFILLASWIIVDKLRLNRRIWVAGLSLITLLIATEMCIERWPL
ncbi:MAG: HupE / UreJ protein [Niastella sp. SCN 39-18]|nr:HupE/UreJ family protein [Sphingobacteriales bacterium]ODT52321.1 MAG: HupE / UreJ protein [Niastella sp. SCN 39-18]OJW10404.1 MAG: HupE / UreJ protein [Sphingobacteriales bacterium 39-19]